MERKRFEFSKLLLVFETVLVAALSACTLYFCYISIKNGYNGTLPYLTTMTTAAWGAYGFSVKYYYEKSGAENRLKIELGGAQTSNINRDC